jgi:uncharacterized membrane protein YfcA
MILGFETFDFFVFIVISLLICITLCTLAMEASVLFLPAFLFLFPFIIANFPDVTPNEAIGLAITIEFFGYTSSVTGYWLRGQVDFRLGMKVLAITVPLAIVGRLVAYFIPGNGLLLVFGLVLIALAFIIFREYQGEIRHTCLLCGDSLMAMRYESAEKSAEGATTTGTGADTGKKKRPRFNVSFDNMDRGILSIGGAFGGFIGVAIGEIANTFLSVRKQVPVKVATGTAALVLHITILSALATNVVIIYSDFELFQAKDIEIPWTIAWILAPVVIVGGQIGSYINSKISDQALIRSLMTAYVVIGVWVLFNITTM